jgi:hypothetical protein
MKTVVMAVRLDAASNPLFLCKCNTLDAALNRLFLCKCNTLDGPSSCSWCHKKYLLKMFQNSESVQARTPVLHLKKLKMLQSTVGKK